MNDKFTINFDNLAQGLAPANAYRLKDVEHRIEKVAYDLVRFRENSDTDQLWKIKESPDGEAVIVALYDDGGSLSAESVEQAKNDWEAIPDKTAMNIYYKGEPLVSLSSDDMGMPVEDFGTCARWLPQKLAGDDSLQKSLFKKMASASREHLSARFPELTSLADMYSPFGEAEAEPEIRSTFAPEESVLSIDGGNFHTDPEDPAEAAEAAGQSLLDAALELRELGKSKEEIIKALFSAID